MRIRVQGKSSAPVLRVGRPWDLFHSQLRCSFQMSHVVAVHCGVHRPRVCTCVCTCALSMSSCVLFTSVMAEYRLVSHDMVPFVGNTGSKMDFIDFSSGQTGRGWRRRAQVSTTTTRGVTT